MTTSISRPPLLRISTVVAFAVLLSASECPVDDNTPDDGNGGGTDDTPVASSMSVVQGDGQDGTVGTALAEDLIVQVNSQFGNPMSGVTVTFAVTGGGGSVSPTSATTDSDGQASTTWTLGTAAGDQEVEASVSGISSATVFEATATSDVAASVVADSGDGQTGFPDTELSNPIVVRVLDEYGNGVPNEEVTFSVASGGGSVSPTTDTTDADGYARTTWTLGSGIGTNVAEAAASGLTGSPVSFTATATALSITSVSPDPLVEGGTATITGTGFDLTAGNNTVTVDGAAATVTDVAGSTSLTIAVPVFDCRPERAVDVVLSVSGFEATQSDHTLEPQEQLGIAVGEQIIVRDPADFCLQFAASPSDAEYLIGVGAAAEVPSGTMPFTMTSVSGVSAAPPAMLARTRSPSAVDRGIIDPAHAALVERQAEREAEIRAYERRVLDPRNNPSVRYLSGRAMGERPFAAAVMASANDTVGNERDFRVPGDSCSAFTPITATARVVGESGIWYTDNANPTGDALTLADIENASDIFDDFIFPFATTFFGSPSDIDGNSKILIVLTKEVNATGAAGFVYSGDLVERSRCAYSDEGEIFYGYVPDAEYSRQSVLDFLPVLIAHEFTHNIQISRRIILLDNGTFPASWIAEGQATFAEEVVGHAHTGNSPGNNYGVAVATSGPPYWYWQGITKLGYYFGGNGVTKLMNAPEDCTLFGNFSDDIGICNTSSFYGASWSMLRYLTDRLFSADPSAFHRDIIDANPSLTGVANIEAITGMEFDSLFAQWGAMLYVDDWVAGAPAELTMPSWDLPAVLSAVAATANLEPEERSFADFSDSRSVRGGSHAYTIVGSSGARPALAVRVRDASDDILGTTLTPILWVVRIQ